MKNYVFLIALTLLACGGISVFSSETRTSEDQSILDSYRIQCKTGCKHLETLADEADGDKPCLQARDHDGMDCVEYCVFKMQTDSNTDPVCWTKLKTCAGFEEQCHFGELY